MVACCSISTCFSPPPPRPYQEHETSITTPHSPLHPLRSDRSKAKVYEKSKGSLEDVGITLSCSTDVKVLPTGDEIEKKVQAMEIVIKQYKKLVCKAEQELRLKDRVYHALLDFD